MIPARGLDRLFCSIGEEQKYLTGITRDPPYFGQRDRAALGDNGPDAFHILGAAGDD
jgi:hypothetical protein